MQTQQSTLATQRTDKATGKPIVTVDETLARKVARYARYTRAESAIELRKKRLAADIFAATGNAACVMFKTLPNGTEAKVGTISECERVSLDAKALLAKYPDIFAEFKRETEYLMLRTS